VDNRKLLIEGIEVPLSEGVNIPVNKSIVDISEPDKRTSDFTKEFLIPASKEANQVFGHIWDINVDSTFNPNLKLNATYLEGGEIIVEGFVRLLDIKETDRQEKFYQIQLLGSLSNIFRELGVKEIDDAEMEWEDFNHVYRRLYQSNSWDTSIQFQGLGSGGTIPFELGRGYVYGMIDYGRHTYSSIYDVTDMIPQVYAREILLRIFQNAGYTWNSVFLDSTEFKSMVVTANQTASFGISDAEVIARSFSANDVQMETSGNNTISVQQALNSNGGTTDKIINLFSIFNPSGAYDSVTGIWTCPTTGYYGFRQELDITATLTPGAGGDPLMTLNGSVAVVVAVEKYNSTFGAWIPISSEGVYIGSNLVPTAGLTTTGTSYPDSNYQTAPFSLSYSGSSILWSGGNVYNHNPPKQLESLSFSFSTQIIAGQQVRAVVKTLWERELLNDSNGVPFADSDGWFISPFDNTKTTDGTVTLTVSNSLFRNQVLNAGLNAGDVMEVQNVIPKKIKQKDFFKGIINMFNLFLQPDPDNPKILNIDPRPEFYNTEIEDFSELWAKDKPMKSEPMGALDARTYEYTYQPDKDYYNEDYLKVFDRVYGNRQFDVDNDFETGTKKTEVIFAPTPSAGYTNNDRVVPIIIKLDNAQSIAPIDSKMRILYYGGLKACNENWFHRVHNQQFGEYARSTYPYVGMWSDPYNPVTTLDFGLPRKIYWDNTFQPINATNNNLFNRFYKQYIEEIIDPQSRIVTGWFWLSSSQMRKIDFKKLYWWNNTYFRLNRIIDYKNNQLTKCEFLKLNFADPFVLNIVPIGGGKDESIGDEVVPIFNDNVQPNVNSFKPNKGNVFGQYNNISPTAENISVQGDSNTIGGKSTNIFIIGEKNTIAPNLKNVTLINSNGITVVKSNTTYVNDKLISTGGFSDIYSGIMRVPLEDTVEIIDNRQMINYGGLKIDGVLDIKGMLILK